VVVVDSVYSTTGAVCPLREMVEVVEKHGAMILVDESHSLGTHGPRGAGLCAELGLTDRVHFITASLAKAMAGRDQRYFDDFTGKRMALYSGYHYGFAGFNADQEQLRQTFQAVLTYSHDSNLLMVQRGRVDLTVVARSYLALYLTRHPQLRQALLVSERADQYYQHQALLRAQAPISSTQLSQLLEQLRGTAEYAALLARYDLQAR